MWCDRMAFLNLLYLCIHKDTIVPNGYKFYTNDMCENVMEIKESSDIILQFFAGSKKEQI